MGRHRRWVTHFRVAPNRKAQTALQVLGDDPAEVVICDRFSAYNWVLMRSWCWAHLRRDFQAMIDRDDGGSATGRSLLNLSDALFWGWHRVADDELSWDDFLRWAGSIRLRVHEELVRGASCPSPKTSATCRHLLGGEGRLWRFLAGDGVEPTDNRAERAIRHGVLWQKTSGRAASESGSRFVSRMPTVVETCRQRGRSVLEHLTSCFEASVRSQPVPLLLHP